VRALSFIATREHGRFAELCDACRRERYIGLCYGPPGVGKTLSARHYAGWDGAGPVHLRYRMGAGAPARLLEARTLVYTPSVASSPRQIAQEMSEGLLQLHWTIADAIDPDPNARRPLETLLAAPTLEEVELVIVDEADRLRTQGLEQVRDHFDRTGIAVVLIGMPGLERRLARYPQLFSRVGFAHEYRPLRGRELDQVLAAHCAAFGLDGTDHDPDARREALATAALITGGNFRLIGRLFSQAARILDINGLSALTREVIETARRSLGDRPRLGQRPPQSVIRTPPSTVNIHSPAPTRRPGGAPSPSLPRAGTRPSPRASRKLGHLRTPSLSRSPVEPQEESRLAIRGSHRSHTPPGGALLARRLARGSRGRPPCRAGGPRQGAARERREPCLTSSRKVLHRQS
jgi:DNA transposition AAA+ family ATPase